MSTTDALTVLSVGLTAGLTIGYLLGCLQAWPAVKAWRDATAAWRETAEEKK